MVVGVVVVVTVTDHYPAVRQVTTDTCGWPTVECSATEIAIATWAGP